TNLSPHMPHSSPQSIQMTSAGWSPAGQYFYPHQYPVPVASFPVVTTTSRSPIIPPPTTRKAIAIIDPATGTAVNTSPMSLTSHPHPQHQKEEKHFDFKVPAVSKPVVIVDPAIRDRELREKKEREEAEQEAKRKEEEEAAEKARKAKEEEEERERLAKEEEQKRLQKEAEEAEEAEKERLEKERLENERLAAAAAAAAAEAVERQRQEEEALRKIEEENESRRVINELEADRKRQEEKKKQAKIIQDPSTIEYPPGIKAPAASPEGTQRHVYSIDFLLQFQQICLDTDEEVSNIIQRELSESNTAGSNRLGMGSSMRQPSDRGKNPPRTPGGTNLSPDTMFKMGSRDGRMEMGKFNMGRPLTARNNSQYMERQGSMGRGGSMMSRGGGRGGGSGGMKIIRNPPQQQPMNGSSFEPVTPLEKSENRWVPSVIASSAAQPPAEGELMSQEYIVRKVNALLNKLTLEKFDTITPQIFEYARQSAKEDDGRSLHTVMQLVFEKACDEPAFANMWARLCHYMYNSMTDDIKDVTLLNEQKKPSSGVLLFRKYLFNRCQQEFEKGWKVNMPEVDETDGVLSDEYYAAVKAKRQGLGLIQ
ncbi:Eukaryotic translation initiation factor 4 gamma, partial [Choanephora cucurbitarum]